MSEIACALHQGATKKCHCQLLDFSGEECRVFLEFVGVLSTWSHQQEASVEIRVSSLKVSNIKDLWHKILKRSQHSYVLDHHTTSSEISKTLAQILHLYISITQTLRILWLSFECLTSERGTLWRYPLHTTLYGCNL